MEMAGTIPVIAEETGARYNLHPNTPMQPIKATPGLISATLTIQTNGTDAQTDEALRTVVLDAYTSIIQGAVSAKYTAILKKTEPAITSTAIDRTPDGFNSVDIYVQTEGAPLSTKRKKELLKTLDSIRPASTTLRIKDAIPVPVNITMTVDRASGTATDQAILTALQAFFHKLKIHQSIEERDLYKALEHLSADTLFITAPNAPILVQKHQAATLGTLTINGGTV